MVKYLNEIQYKFPNIGFFPLLDKFVKHGFSWGKDAGNTQFSLGNKTEIRQRIQDFLKTLYLGDIKQSFDMVPEHKDNIIYLDKDLVSTYKPRRLGYLLDCDAIFTSMPNATLIVKPADCTTAIIYCKNRDNKEIVGIVHSGRRGVEKQLPKKAVEYLIAKLNCDPKQVLIGILPHLFKENRKFEHLDDIHDLAVWDGFIDKKDGFYYLAETECALKQYQDAGICPDNIEIYDIDTYASAEKGESFSYKYHYEMARIGKEVPNGRMIVAASL